MSKKKFACRLIFAFIELTRLPMAILSGIATCAVIYQTATGLWRGWLACFTAFVFMAATMVINDWFDIEIDKINKPNRPIPSGIISPRQALLFGELLWGIFIFMLLYLGEHRVVIIGIVFMLLSIGYSWRLKKVFILGHVITGLVMTYPLVLGGMVGGNLNEMLPLVLSLWGYIFGREIVKTSEDIPGDRKGQVDTLATRYGMEVSAKVGSLLMWFPLILLGLHYILTEKLVFVAYMSMVASLIQTGLTLWLWNRVTTCRITKFLDGTTVIMFLVSISLFIKR